MNRNSKKKNKVLIKLMLIIIIILVLFIIIHFATFNHHKVKEVTKIKYKEVVSENIVFLGDSITHRYDLNKYYPDYNVVNSGEEGNITDDILDNMYDRVYKYNPSKVFLLIGTNQLEKDKAENIVNDIIKIVSETHKNIPLTKIYVESIYPVNNDVLNTPAKNKDNKKIEIINQKLKKLSLDNNYIYINLYDRLLDEDNHLFYKYTVDGLHINNKGYSFITRELTKYVKD